MIITVLFLFYFLTPLLIIYLCNKFKILNKIGLFIISYSTGIIFGNIGIMPRGSEAFRNLLTGRTFIPKNDALELFQQGVIRHNDLLLNQITSIQDMIISIIIPLSIPLILFSFDLKNLSKILKKECFSIIISIISLIVCALTCNFLFKDSIPDIWKISGMIMGLFIGGIHSLSAVSASFGIVPNLLFIIMIFYLIIGIFLVLFFNTIGQRWFNKNPSGIEKFNSISDLTVEEKMPEKLSKKINLSMILPLTGALAISILLFAVSYGICSFLPSEYRKTSIILLITLSGMFLGLIPKIKKIEKTFDLGMYFILVFCLITSSMVDFRTIFQPELLYIFLFMITTVCVSISLIFTLTAILRINTDITIATIAALFMPPASIPILSDRIKKKEMIETVFTISLFGIAIGNLLSIFFSFIVKSF
jgi:uncharacterized membrane protein